MGNLKYIDGILYILIYYIYFIEVKSDYFGGIRESEREKRKNKRW